MQWGDCCQPTTTLVVGLTLSFDFVEQEKDWVLAIEDLPAGLYRMKVQAENLGEEMPIPVHDVFEVVRGE